MASDYIHPHISQLNSGPCSHTNCWAATGAYLVASATRGKVTPTPHQFRKAAGRVKGCPPGGLGDIIVGCAKYGVKARLLLDLPRKELRRRLSNNKAEKVYAIPFDWEAWPDHEKGLIDYSGYHSAAVIPGTNKRKSIRTMDPLYTRRKVNWVRRGDIIDAAIQYNDEHYGQKKGTVDCVVVSVRKR